MCVCVCVCVCHITFSCALPYKPNTVNTGATGKRLARRAQRLAAAAAPSMLADRLEWSAAKHGHVFISRRVKEYWTSQTCLRCRFINKPSSRYYKCTSCGFTGHRDVCAAANIAVLAIARHQLWLHGPFNALLCSLMGVDHHHHHHGADAAGAAAAAAPAWLMAESPSAPPQTAPPAPQAARPSLSDDTETQSGPAWGQADVPLELPGPKGGSGPRSPAAPLTSDPIGGGCASIELESFVGIHE